MGVSELEKTEWKPRRSERVIWSSQFDSGHGMHGTATGTVQGGRLKNGRGIFLRTRARVSTCGSTRPLQKCAGLPNVSPALDRPHCDHEIPGLEFDADEGQCPKCKRVVFLTDMIGLTRPYCRPNMR